MGVREDADRRNLLAAKGSHRRELFSDAIAAGPSGGHRPGDVGRADIERSSTSSAAAVRRTAHHTRARRGRPWCTRASSWPMPRRWSAQRCPSRPQHPEGRRGQGRRRPTRRRAPFDPRVCHRRAGQAPGPARSTSGAWPRIRARAAAAAPRLCVAARHRSTSRRVAHFAVTASGAITMAVRGCSTTTSSLHGWIFASPSSNPLREPSNRSQPTSPRCSPIPPAPRPRCSRRRFRIGWSPQHQRQHHPQVAAHLDRPDPWPDRAGLRRRRRAASFPDVKVRPHAFRHSYAQRLADSGPRWTSPRSSWTTARQ